MSKRGDVARELVRSRVEFHSGLRRSRIPSRQAEIKHTKKCSARGFAVARIKWRIHHQIPVPHKSHQLCRLPHGKISLSPYGDNSLNLVHSLSNVVQLEAARNRYSGRPFGLVKRSKVCDNFYPGSETWV